MNTIIELHADDEDEAIWQPRRKHRRKAVLWAAHIESASGSFTSILLDLSLGGARLRFNQHTYTAGEAVTLYLERLGPLNATVAWQRRGQIGLRFTDAPELIAEVVGGKLPL